MAIRLTAQPGDLPLAFQKVHEHLLGSEADAYLVAGQPTAGAQLDLLLSQEGSGLKPVTIRGEFAQAGYNQTTPYQLTTEVAGQLDAPSLARVVHALSRQFIAPYGKGNTPPEVYVTSIDVGDVKRPPPFIPQPPKRRKGQRFAAYLDAKTGEYVPRDKYLRSRRSMRGVATRKGLAKPPKGRYVRVLLDYSESDDEPFASDE